MKAAKKKPHKCLAPVRLRIIKRLEARIKHLDPPRSGLPTAEERAHWQREREDIEAARQMARAAREPHYRAALEEVNGRLDAVRSEKASYAGLLEARTIALAEAINRNAELRQQIVAIRKRKRKLAQPKRRPRHR